MIEEGEAGITRSADADLVDDEAAEQEFDGQPETLMDFMLEFTD